MSTLIDVAILVLLIGTLSYTFVVDRRVRRMMQALKEMQPMIGSFSDAVDRSESTVSALRSMGQAEGLFSNLQRGPSATASASTSGPAEPKAAGAAEFRSRRERPARPQGATPVHGKSELVRGFFETVRKREV
ncbi:flagellar motor switch protein [Sagittula salina]|uniref:Flagellar motor switch protein n=1 Tax=Sagittula salina TaxID=2820268 RepID=A0A940MTX7_9RHOB|nr:flagellar motor switch protein [Sagittula salina]MBP0484598.1 flagellar motor switch protein [Sagittula salina]